jgi:uncharacterized protein
MTRRQFLRLAAFAAGLGALYPTFIERNLIVTNTYRIIVPHLPEPFVGLRIIQLTDLHYGPLMPIQTIERVIARANRLAGDLIVCTGDYVRGRDTTEQIDIVWPVISRLTAPMGVFSVLGNHDHWADTERSVRMLQASGQNLHHRTIALERDGQQLWLAGTGDLWEDHHDLDLLLSNIPEEACRIVLAHNPDTADIDYTSRIDLMLSGHTHGGQVDLPFLGVPIVPVRNKTYTSGLKRSPRGTQVFISKGIGWSIAPVRFNCYPEIAVLELFPA